jgi:hypothetical protein
MKNECKKISTSNFLAIPGIECKLNENVHLLISGLGKRRSEQLRTIVHINKEFLKKRFFNLKSIDCIEVWNRYNDGILPNSKSLQIFTKLKENYGNLHATGGLELHSSIQTDIIIEVLCEKLTEKQILTSIKRGHFISYSKNIILFPDGNITYLKNRNMLFVKNVIYLFLRKVAIFGRKLSWKPKPILKIYHKICGEK